MGKELGVIVDGEGDFAALNKRFGTRCRIVKSDGPRGHGASMNGIVRGTRKQVNMLRGYGCGAAIVLVDFEDRQVPYRRFCEDLDAAFAACNFGIPVYLAVPNKMIENWYLADIEELSRRRNYIRPSLAQRRYEGKHGKNELKKCFVRDVSYRETRHGPQLFQTIRIQVARGNSQSLNAFLDLVERKRAR